MRAILEIQQVSKFYGGLKAVDQVSFEVGRGELLSLIGPNGAGKTTLLNLLSGIDRSDTGKILFEGHDITGLPARKIAQMGIRRSFQLIRLVRSMTVLENVLSAVLTEPRGFSWVEAVFSSPRATKELREALERAQWALELVALADRSGDQAGDLAYGQQRLVELARAIVSRPKLLLLDEPAAGLNSAEKARLGKLLKEIQAELGCSIIMVEHEMHLVMQISDRVVVLNYGRKIAEGTPTEVARNEEVISAYLGGEKTVAAAG